MGTNSQPLDVLAAAGPRASASALLDWLRAHRLSLAALRAGEQRPIRVLVPNAALRTHMSARIAEELGGVVAGVRVQTLYGYAREALEAAGIESRPAGALEQLFVRRATAASTQLGPLLSELEGGLDAPLRSVRDLLGAGFDVGRALPSGLRAALHSRSQAVLDLAAEVQALASASGLDLVSEVITKAAMAIESGARQPDARALAVFGFSDATGVGARLLRAALARTGGVYIVDCPPSRLPGREGRLEQGRARLLCESVTGKRPPEPSRVGESPSFDFYGASGPRGEVVEVARRIRTLLDAGARPEGIAVVGGDIGAYQPAIRAELPRLGVPFSGGGCRFVPGDLARWRGLPELLSNPDAFAVDRLFDLVHSLAGQRLSFDNRVALRAGYRRLGLSTLSGLTSAKLPQRTDFVTQLDAPSGKGGTSTRRLSVSPTLHAGCTALAQDLLDAFQSWPEQASLETHTLALGGLLDLLGFSDGAPCPEWLRVGWEFPDHSVSFSEFVALLEGRIDANAQSPLGGRGGGVSVLSLRDSRALTFDTLFVLGAQRGAFPPSRADDPILPEAERRLLRGVLVDLPQVGDDLDSSRYGLSQLLDSARSVVLSWSSRDSSGREIGPAPLVRHLHGAKPDERLPESPPRRGARMPSPSPVEDHLMAAALHGERSDFHRLRAAFLPPALGPVREAILEEFDPDRTNKESASRLGRLGPYLGQVGSDSDRSAVVHSATSLERIAACPWQGFLKGSLKLSSTRDPRDGIPVVTSALLGTLVHAVLEEVAVEAGASRGGELDAPHGVAAGAPFRHPGRETIDRLSLECAGEVLTTAGLHLPGLAEMLQRRALPLIESAFEDVAGGAPVPEVLLVETAGFANVLGRRLSFRADRVDRDGDALRIVDYKSGAPPSVAKRESTRRGSYLKAIRSGKRLQGGIYAASTGAEPTVGAYLFLKPDLELEQRSVLHPSDDPELSDAFEQAARTIFTALDAGNFFPRLTDPSGDKEGGACEYCEFTNACLRGDSAQRGRLVRYARSLGADEQMGFGSMWKMPLGESEGAE